MHECNVMRTVRSDGSWEDSTMKSAVGEMSISRSEAPTLSAEELFARANAMADNIARQLSQSMFGSLHNTLANAGQVVDGKGGGFTKELFLEVLETIQMDFDEHGKPNLQMVVHPDMLPHLEKIDAETRDDTAFAQKHSDLLERKRREWRDREASRKLVG